MMESLAYEIALNNLEAFKHILDKINRDVPDKYYVQVRNAAIQKFTDAIDTFLEFLELYMLHCLDIYIKTPSPRITIKEALNANVVSKKEYDLLMDCVTSRGEISDAYSEEIAQQLSKKLRSYYDMMHTVIIRTDMD